MSLAEDYLRELREAYQLTRSGIQRITWESMEQDFLNRAKQRVRGPRKLLIPLMRFQAKEYIKTLRRKFGNSSVAEVDYDTVMARNLVKQLLDLAPSAGVPLPKTMR